MAYLQRQWNRFLLDMDLRGIMTEIGCQDIDEIFRDGRLVCTDRLLRNQEVQEALRKRWAETSNGCLVRQYKYNFVYQIDVTGKTISTQFAQFYGMLQREFSYGMERPCYYARTQNIFYFFDLENYAAKQQLSFYLLGQCSVAKNKLIKYNRHNFNFYATQTNVVQIVDANLFPYGAKYYLDEKRLYINKQMNMHFNLRVDQNGFACDLEYALRSLGSNASIHLTGYCFYNSLANNLSLIEVNKACASYLCIVCSVESLPAAYEWAQRNFAFAPNVYLPDNLGMLPNFVPHMGKYISFAEAEALFSNDEEINTQTSASGLKVLSWNLQNQGTLGFVNSMAVVFPFALWKSYKYPRMIKTILAANADVCCFSEAQPIVELFESSPDMKAAYFLKYQGINSDTKLPPGKNCYSALLLAKTLKIVHEEYFPYSKLSYSVPLAQQLNVKGPLTLAKLESFECFNTATFAVVEKDGVRAAVCAIYPIWQYTIEPVKYFYIKYALQRCDQLKKTFSCAFQLIAGDFNMSATGMLYQSLYRTVSVAEADNMVTEQIEADQRIVRQATRIFYSDYCSSLDLRGLRSAFAEPYSAKQLATSVEGMPHAIPTEPVTTVTPTFCECLDYHLTDAEVAEKCPVFNSVAKKMLPNAKCVSDHSPLVSVLRPRQ